MSMLGCNRQEAEENNPKTMQLAKLVTLIEPKLLCYYLEQVSVFLKNEKRDMWFPLITDNLDAFLVRIIQNTQNLKCVLHVLDERNKELVLDIIETLEANQNKFTVMHKYLNSHLTKHILMYRKCYEIEKLESVKTVIDNIDELCFSPIKVHHQGMDTPTDRVTIPTDEKENTVTHAFKVHWVNATLHYIQNTTAKFFDFPAMNIKQFKYVYSLVQPGRIDKDTDLSMREAYVPLIEALKKLNKSHEIKTYFTDINRERIRLTLVKVPMNNNKAETDREEAKENNSNSPENNHSKSQKAIERKAENIKHLEPSFIRTSLHIILDFISETTETSIVFRNADDKQCAFLQSFIATAKTRKLHEIFSEESRTLLRKIAMYLANDNFNLKVELAKMEKNTTLRSVVICKVPKEKKVKPRAPTPVPRYDKSEPQTSSPSAESSDRESPYWQERNQPPTPSTNTKTPKSIDNVKVPQKCENIGNITIKVNNTQKSAIANKKIEFQEESIDIKKEKSISNTKIVEEDRANDNTEKTSPREVKIKDKPPEVKKAIDSVTEIHKSIDKLLIDNSKSLETVNKLDKNNNNKTINSAQILESVGKGLGLRKARLIEGLSTPLESDVAIRMMRQMGWEGGPLGLRGEGLMEPVMPAIHLKAGAGLGHVAPKKEPKPKPVKKLPPKVPQTQPEPLHPPQRVRPSRTIHCHKPPDVRMDILRHILILITEEELERIVVYSTKLSKKEIKFVESTVKILARRGTLIFTDNEMQDVYNRIIDELQNGPNLKISFYMGNDKNLVLTKDEIEVPNENIAPPVPDPSPKLPPVENIISIASKYISANFITTEAITMLGNRLAPTQSIKSIKPLGHNIIILATLFDLVQSCNTEKTIKFDYPITCKKVTYIKWVLWGIRHKAKWPCSNTYENFLSTKILDSTEDDTYVCAIYTFNNQHITFKKVLRPNKNIDSLKPTQEKVEFEENNNNDTKVNGTDNAKDDAKTGINDVIVISDSDDDSAKNASNNDVGAEEKDKDSTTNTSLESEFVSDVEDKFVNEEGNTKDESAEDDKDNIEYSNSTVNSDESDKNDNAYVTKYLGIAPEGYPMENVGVDEIISLQNKIFDKLDNTDEKPLLECIGIKNGAIIYRCFNEFGRILIKSSAEEMGLHTMNINNMFKKNKPYKMTARINSFVEIDLKNLFRKVERYNLGLKTDLWCVLGVQPGDGFITISLEIDEDSFEYIAKNNFSIFAGFDKMRFGMTWD